MADHLAVLLSHQRHGQQAIGPKHIDDAGLGPAAVPGAGEGGGGQRADGVNVGGAFGADLQGCSSRWTRRQGALASAPRSGMILYQAPV